jgi:hypothetical protein
MTEIDLTIDVRGDLELRDVLTKHGVRWRPHAGIFNGPPPDPSQIAKMIEALHNAPPYLIVTGGAAAVILAFAEYRRVTKKKLTILREFGRTKIDATNWTPEDFQKVDHLDMFKFEKDDHDT